MLQAFDCVRLWDLNKKALTLNGSHSDLHPQITWDTRGLSLNWNSNNAKKHYGIISIYIYQISICAFASIWNICPAKVALEAGLQVGQMARSRLPPWSPPLRLIRDCYKTHQTSNYIYIMSVKDPETWPGGLIFMDDVPVCLGRFNLFSALSALNCVALLGEEVSRRSLQGAASGHSLGTDYGQIMNKC